MEPFIKDIGKMIFNMEKVQKYGETQLNIKDNITKEKKKVKEDCNLQTVRIMKVNSKIIESRVRYWYCCK